MFWLIILSLFILLAIIVYFGALSPFAKLQQAANKHWNEAIALFCELDNWELSCNKDGVTTSKEHRIWRVAGPKQQIMYIRYLGKESDNEAIRDVEKILSSKTALSYMIGKVVQPTKKSCFNLFAKGTWGGFLGGDEVEFVISRLQHLGLVQVGDSTLYSGVSQSGQYLCYSPTVFPDANPIYFWFKNDLLTNIHMRLGDFDSVNAFRRKTKLLISKLGVPSGQVDYSISWGIIRLFGVEDDTTFPGLKSGLYLMVDFRKPFHLDIRVN